MVVRAVNETGMALGGIDLRITADLTGNSRGQPENLVMPTATVSPMTMNWCWALVLKAFDTRHGAV